MYRLTNQVCSLTQAQELHELGVRCESLWSWEIDTGEIVHDASGCPVPDIYIPAYTCSELGVMLPDKLKNIHWISIEYRKYYLEYIVEADGIFIIKGKTEAQARASALIWLIKSGHIKAEDIKL